MSSNPFDSEIRPALPRELFWKKYMDPLSGVMFSGVSVKHSAYAVQGHDPDFAPHYDGVDPLWYAVIVSSTGFAAEDAIYQRSSKLLFRDRDGLTDLIKGQPALPELNRERDIELACRSYELALGYTRFLRIARNEIAALALKASWVYRQWFNAGHAPAEGQARVMRGIALEHYMDSFESEDTSELKLGSAGVSYLVAELLREHGRFDESLQWFSRTLADKQIGGKVKRLAQDRRDLCREQRTKAKETGNYSKPEPERSSERAMYQLYRDQTHWLKQTTKESKLGESEIMRGVLDGLKDSDIDLQRFRSEKELAEWLSGKLKGS